MKYIKFNYFFIGLVTLLLASALWPAIPWHTGKQDSLAQIQARGVLRISTLNSALTYQQIKDQSQGMDYELAKRFADYLGVKLEVTVRPTIKSLFNDLSEQHADLLAAGLNWDANRAQEFVAGPAYYSTSQQLVYRVDKPRPKNLSDLQGTLSILEGSTFAQTLEAEKAARSPHLQWATEQYLGPQQILREVVEGKIDYTIADSATIEMMQRIYPKLAVAFTVTEDKPVNWYIGAAQSDSLHAAMLDFFNQLNEQGTLARLEEKYLGHSGSFDYVDTRSFLQAVDTRLPTLKPVFEKYAQNFDWQLLAAMAWQESHWDPHATSPTGVRGMMMLTKTTASSLDVSNRLDTEESIRGGSEYLQRLLQRLPREIPKDERIWFALAAYNIGLAHLMDARQLTVNQGGDPNSWGDVKVRLPLLGKKRYYSQTTYGYARGQEAYNYVEKVRKYNLSLVGYLNEMEQQPLDTPHSPSGITTTPLEPQLVMN
ncbi:membrane-bound lytic murein transglycosylase MltF [Tatumella sp. TA1]|uniref:membrane-bound lytic murein transglycosylase MltF n=1 Tax=Rosenbergiella collisarenosi TaxID=1544695 RepID=UPI0008F88A9D|nr:membrane-bound lytic murein transglycosylase MltF [Rosenbergiella collisarenosi]MBT0720249.1 membrane-bound lytic murein transglycosylase MltF [Rosenbergiella collisarenosi]QGX92034.1 membrane-bound lytic murein transglycosylase MltF [Tatumella sp. TA1]